MGKFLVGIMAGSLLGYWCGINYPDSFIRDYLPFDDYKRQEQQSEYKAPNLEEFLEKKAGKLCELEEKINNYKK